MFSFFFLEIHFFKNVCVQLYEFMHSTFMQVSSEAKRYQILWNCSYQSVDCHLAWMLGTEPRPLKDQEALFSTEPSLQLSGFLITMLQRQNWAKGSEIHVSERYQHLDSAVVGSRVLGQHRLHRETLSYKKRERIQK